MPNDTHTDSESEFDEVEWTRKNDIIERMFPDSHMSICIDLDDFNEVITEQRQVLIQLDHTCYCYDGNSRPTVYIPYTKPSGYITNYDLIKVLYDSNYSPDCNHRFLESFQSFQLNHSNIIEVYFGS